MNLSELLQSWYHYVHQDDFLKLSDFLTRTQNGEKLNKILVLYGTGGNGKTTFLRQLEGLIKITNTSFNDMKTLFGRNYVITENSNLIAIPEIEPNYQFDDQTVDTIEKIVNDEIFEHRKLYGKFIEHDKIKGNFIVCTNSLNEFSKVQNNVEVIRFTHKF